MDPSNRVSSLRRFVPKAGMLYQFKHQLMARSHRDKKVEHALRETGYEISRTGLQRAFVPMFQLAKRIFVTGRARNEDLWDMLPEVQNKLNWASELSEEVFFELFTRLVEARHNWEMEPRSPDFDPAKYSRTVFELILFREVVGDCPQLDDPSNTNYNSWILTDAQIYNQLAGCLYESESEDEDEDEDEEEEGEDTGIHDGSTDDLNNAFPFQEIRLNFAGFEPSVHDITSD